MFCSQVRKIVHHFRLGKIIDFEKRNYNAVCLCLIQIGKEFFVGLSQWTNEGGAKAVAAAFPEYPCVPIKVCAQNTCQQSFFFLQFYNRKCIRCAQWALQRSNAIFYIYIYLPTYLYCVLPNLFTPLSFVYYLNLSIYFVSTNRQKIMPILPMKLVWDQSKDLIFRLILIIANQNKKKNKTFLLIWKKNIQIPFKSYQNTIELHKIATRTFNAIGYSRCGVDCIRIRVVYASMFHVHIQTVASHRRRRRKKDSKRLGIISLYLHLR